MSAILQTPGGFFQAPEVSQAEIDSFHDTHFSHTAVQFFDVQFFHPEHAQDKDDYYEGGEEYYEEEEEDDGLGYYPDGVKRTLTDEQIAIFRHSELETLRRAQTKASKLRQESAALLQEAKEQDAKEEGDEDAKFGADPESTSLPPIQDEDVVNNDKDDGEVQDGSEDGEIEAEAPQLTKAEERRIKKQRARRKKQEQRKFQPEKKPDLRKRTWDVVEAGMDSLDYDELEKAQDAAATPAAQRRRISYDD
ncbi:Casein kinase II subunit alpha' [Hypoxylon texense]